MKRLLDAREVGTLLKLSPRTVYTKAWRRRVGLPAYRICGVLRFRPEDVESALNELRESAAEKVLA
jgi:hypothetical protein